MLARGLFVVLLVGALGGVAQARTIYTIAGGGHLRPPQLGEPAVPATAVALGDVGGVSARPNGELVIETTPRLLLDQRGMVRAIPNTTGPPALGADRNGVEYFIEDGRLLTRRAGAGFEQLVYLGALLPSGATNLLVHPEGGVMVAALGVVLRVMPDGTAIRVAGTGRRGHSADGGPANEATLRYPTDLVWGPGGALLIADRDDNRVRRVDPRDGRISTVAGSGEQGFGGDGGPATAAPLDWPVRLTVGRHGGFAIAEDGYPSPRIRRVGRDGIIHTVVGGGPERAFGRGTSLLNGDGGSARKASLSAPSGMHVTGRDEYVFADINLVRIASSPRTTRLAVAPGRGAAATAGELHAVRYGRAETRDQRGRAQGLAEQTSTARPRVLPTAARPAGGWLHDHPEGARRAGRRRRARGAGDTRAANVEAPSGRRYERERGRQGPDNAPRAGL